jgi:3-deoxy-D-manno-octulosonic-acid transferase
VLEALNARDASVQSVFTHFSPSAEGLARRIAADVADYLPWDLVSEVGPVLDALAPTLIGFTKTEVWPTLASEAALRGTRMVLVAGTLPESSSRLSPFAQPLLRPAFAKLTVVLAISDEDGSRFARLGVPSGRVTVTGDPGVDSAAQRAAATDPDAKHLRVFRNARPRLVAGSTWPSDHLVLLSACARARQDVPELQLVIAPHEPTPANVTGLLTALRVAGWRAATLAEVEQTADSRDVDAVVVERVGVLAQLYTVGDVAYVGGGFHDQGLHSVLEPAAAGRPVCFGPRHQNARAASELLDLGGARVAEGDVALAELLSAWLSDPKNRDAAGRAAADYVNAHLGAADRCARLLLDGIREARSAV